MVETFVKYKVKDISLAEWGRKEIQLAEAEMPGTLLRVDPRGGAEQALDPHVDRCAPAGDRETESAGDGMFVHA